MKTNGTYPIRLYVKHRGKFLLSTNIFTTIDAWDENGCINKNDKQYKVKNAILRKLLSDAENEYMRLQSIGALPKTDKEYKKHLECVLFGKEEAAPKRNFLSYFDEFVSLKTNKGTASLYRTTRNKIEAFDPDCTFETITRKWLQEFEKKMAESLKVNSYAIHLRNIRAVFNYAIDEGITDCYPFRKYKIRQEETRKRSLTVEQLRLLATMPLEPYQEQYRDIFMLDFYLIGMNIGNLLMMKKSDLHNGRLDYHRNKTNKLISVKVMPEAMAIIEKYSGRGEWLLNIMDRYTDYKYFIKRMNLALQAIGECSRTGLGGKKHITPTFQGISTYWARHTWATIAAELDIPKETIAHALSHSVNDVTSIYIKFDNRKVDEANRKVIDYVNGE